jgi:uncharacterized RDD family membrane protein YckC
MIRRIVAAAIDVCLVLLLTRLLAPATGAFFAARTIPTFDVGSPDTVWRGPIPFLLAFYGRIVYGAPFAAILVLLAEPLFGTSAGKSLLGLRFAAAGGGTPSPSARWIRFLAKGSGPIVFTIALLVASWPLALLGALLGATTWTGFAAVVFGRRALHDVIARTDVVRAADVPV